MINRNGEEEPQFVALSPRKTKNGAHKKAPRENPSTLRSLSRGYCLSPPRKDFDNDDDVDENDVESGRDSQGHRDPKQQKRCLACPMYKYDKKRHRGCSRLQLTRVRDVKQHLLRRHRLPIYCPICKRDFTNEKSRDFHTRERACMEPPEGVSITGITEDQRDALGRRVNRSLSAVEQWNSIWDILYPGIPRPGSPYVANKMEEAIDTVFGCLRDQRSKLMQELGENLGNERFHPLLLPAASELVEVLLGRVREKLLVPASADSEHTSVVTSWDCWPSTEAKAVVPFPNSLDHNSLIQSSDVMVPSPFIDSSSAATLHADAFVAASSTPLSFSEGIGDWLGGSLSSSLRSDSPTQWPSPEDQLSVMTANWEQKKLLEFI